MFEVDAGHPAGDPAEHLVGNGIGLAGDVLGAVADGAAPEDGLVALLHIGHGGDIHHELVHADPAQHRAGDAVDFYDALAAAQQAGVAVGVAGAEGGHSGGGFGGEAPAIAGGLARLQLLDHADHGLEFHDRAELPEADFVAGVEAVQNDAGAGHAGRGDRAAGPVGMEHDPGGVVAVDERRLLPGSL